MTRVFLLENRPIVTAGVRALLAATPGIEITGVRGDAPVTRECVLRARPDVVLVGADVGESELAEIEVAGASPPPWRLVVLGCSPGTSQVRAFRDAGACACLPLDVTTQVMHEVLERVSGGGPHRRAHCDHDCDCPMAAGPNGAFGLTHREHEILCLLAAGHTTSGVADALGLAPSTVSTFIRRIKTRLELETNHELVSFAVLSGLVPSA